MAQQFDIVGNLLLKVDGAEAGLNKLKNSLSQLKMPANLDSNLKKSFSNLDGLFAKYRAQLKDGFNTKGDVTSFAKTGKQIEAEYDRIAATVSKLTGKDISFKVDLTTIQNLEKEIERVVTLKEKLSQDIKGGLGLNDYLKAMQASDVGRRGTKVFDASNMLQTSLGRGDLEKAKTDVEGLISELNRMSDARKKALESHTGIAFNQIITELRTKVTDADQAMNKFGNDIKTTSDTIAQIRADGVDKVTTALNEAVNGTDKAQSGFKQLNGTAQETANSMLSMTKQVEQLQQSTQYFFSLRNMINLFKRGIDDAVQSVKELDKAMTDTAVVTDYNISDLWGMLPQYTQIANELGATTQGAYETMTLYFQQGLDQQQAFEVGAETMKMARIAGLEYAEATDMMTAALRGFNMELNDTSAKRVNDVYSELAAITASDTEELGTAMQRTASIAHSAGASFEGTTAFLAQAIETTREPAENIGTAMKTIIARFQEMKKNPLEISEVEGEEVDFNKIDAALKTIGVDLVDTNGQFREWDKVMLDISARWDTLSQSQQRYIATVAAGSRQQSRFIAMVSNYDRTMELMAAANNSTGASEEQFGKTMDSLEAKLNKLHNAWQRFTMGIANNGMIKLAVDGITGLLTVTNNLIDVFSLGIGPVKSLLSLLMAFTGLKAAGRVANSMIGGLGGLLDPQSSFFKGAKGGFIKNTDSNAQANAISNPIVQAIHQLQAALTGKGVFENTAKTNTASYEQFKTANTDLRTLLKNTGAEGTLSLSAAYGKISGLDNKQQAAILQQLPGLQLNLKRDGIQFDTNGLKNKSAELIKSFTNEINEGLKNNTITPQNAMQIFGTPAGFKKAMEARGPEYVQAAQEAFGDALKQQFTQEEFYKQARESLMSSEDYSYLSEEDLHIAATKEAAKAYEAQTKALENFNKRATITQTKGAMIANSMGNVGTAATSAGQGIAQLGMQLSNAGFDKAGAAVTNLGYQISSLGQIAASTGSLVGKITDAGGIGGLLSAHPYIAAAGVAIAAVGGIIALAKAQEKHAREAAEKTVKTYTDTINETTEKISTLNSAKDIFSQLSSGVDEYGNNIGLTVDEYDQYLQTSQEVAKIAPELIRGYDAQGRAIIDTGSAIDQLISKQEELQNSARDTFVSDSSINDLVSGIRVSDAFKDNSKNVFGDNLGYLQKQTGALRKALQSVGTEEFDAATKQLFGREVNLINPSPDDLRLISEHYGDIYRLIESKNQDLTDRQKEGLQNAFADLGSGWKDMSEELQPLSQAIGQYLSSEGLDTIGLNLGEEFTGAFNAGLQDLTMTAAMENWDASEIKATAREYAEGFKEMTQEGSEYASIMEKVAAEQEKYDDALGEAGAIDNYKAAVEDYATELENLADKYDDGTVAGQLFANSLRETAGHIRNYATESVISLGEAINTLSDEFTSARGAQERFQEATKNGDYYTAAEGYKGIIDTVLDEKNLAGSGSLTFWAGADELLGKDFVDTSSYDEVVAQIKKVQDCFADGSEGALAFNDLLVENQDKLKGLGYAVGNDWHFDLQTEDLEEYAKVLGMSEEALASLIDKARQWVPMDLGDPKKIRQALEASETSMSGTSSRGENLLYTSESSFREEARQQGIRGNDYTKTKTDAESQGIRFLNVENLTTKNGDGLYADQVLENIGLKGADKTLNNATAALAKMGFDLEDTKQILTADGLKLADGQATAEDVEKAYNEQAYAMENPTVAGIANDTGIIASAATAMLASMGILTDEAKKDIEQSTSKDTVDGAKQTLNPEGGFKTTAEHDAAVSQVQARIADYESTINLLKQSGNDALLPQIQQLEAARDSLQQALDADTDSWEAKIEGAKNYVEGIGKTVQEQSFLDAHAFDIQQALQSSDPTTLVTTLQQLQQEGNLSAQTMIDLGASLSHLEGSEVYLAALNSLMGNYQEQVRAARDETYQPFVITSKLEGDDLESYISGIDNLTFKEREILIATDLYGDEKVTAFIDELNTELDGDNTTKTVLIEATAKIANGDTAGANELLQGAFGDQAQQVESKLEILCSGNVANANEVQQSIESQIQALPIETQIETNVKANVTATYTGTAPKAQNATVNYTKGKQDNPDKKSTTVDYTLGKQDPPKTKDAGVNYTWKSQDEPKDKVAYVTYKERARGQNYLIPAHQSISFGSAADGLNLPKKKQAAGSIMTALVGEEGYEVGYIPSEGRSVIFGANGPEMTSFPKDTIIYPHKQSKEILRRGKNDHKTLGSFGGGKDSISSGGLRSSITGKSSTSSSQDTKKQSKDTNKDVKKAAKQVEKTVKDVGDKVYKVTVWWENIARSTQDTQRKMDRAAKDFEKYTKEMQATLKKTGQSVSSGGGGGDDYIKNIQAYKQLNEQQKDRANLELNALETSGLNRKTKQKQLKKEYKKGNIAVEEVSYKKKGKSKTDYVDLSKYIKNGQVDEKALKNITNSAKRKAVAEAASKALNDERSKRNSAEDNIIKAQEALEKMGEELYNTFFAWEIELTKIWNLTKQIEATEKNISRTKTFQETLDKQLSTGRAKYNDPGFAQKSMAAFNTGLSESINKIHAQMELVDQQKKTLQDTLSIEDEKTTLAAVQAKLNQRAVLDKATEQKKSALNQAQAKLNDAKQRQAAKEQTIKDLKKKKKNASKSKKSKIQKQIDAAEKELKNIKNEVNTYTQQVNSANTAYQSALTAATNNLSDTEKLGYENYRDALQDQIKAQTEAKKYLTITQNGDGTVSVDFDTEKFEAEKLKGNITEEQGKAIQDYVKEITDNSAALSDAYQSANASINELYDELEQLQNEWVDYANELWDIHDKEVKERTDNLKKLSDSINKALKKLLDDVKRKLDERRQQEDNRKTELDISQKQQRLAMLQADTSGGHQVEIAQLQKEIAEAQQNYQRSLEDQLLDKLQQQADLAAEQRERQIELEEEISEGVNNAALVDMWMENPEEFEDDIYEAFKKANDYDKKPKVLQEDLDTKFGKLMNGLTTNQKKQEAVNDAIDSIEDTVDKIRLSLALMTANISNAKDVGLTLKEAHEYLGASYKDLGDPSKGKYTIQDFIDEGISYADAKQAFAPDKLKEYEFYREEATKDIIDTAKLNLDKAWKAYYYSNQQTVDNYNKALATAQQLGIDTSQYDVAKLIAEQKSKEEAERVAQAAVDAILASLRSLTNSFTFSARTQASQITAIGVRYATGGLADFNGPAWLDGTPSKPELVLNPQDTQNFLALRDVLSKAIGSTNSINNSYDGDNIFEINVNVDKIEKDYDVDRVIEKVKKEITKGAGYRNVTQVRNFR